MAVQCTHHGTGRARPSLGDRVPTIEMTLVDGDDWTCVFGAGSALDGCDLLGRLRRQNFALDQLRKSLAGFESEFRA